jgi:hypothetical protein
LGAPGPGLVGLVGNPPLNITSHIGAPQENLASHLNSLLKPYIDSTLFTCKNSSQCVQKIKELNLTQEDRMISFDTEAPFPSVPISDCIDVIRKKLEADSTLHICTKLTPTDICSLLSLCLSSSDFVYDGRYHTTKDSGPIGLALMVCVAQIWMTYTIEGALVITEDRGLILPRHISMYMDDCWCVMRYQPPPRRPGLRSSITRRTDPAADFNDCPNAVHPRVKFMQEEEVDGTIAFLDVHLSRLPNGRISTCVYRKPSNTNIIIQPTSCQDPNIITSTFKSKLCRAHRLCTSPTQTKKEIKFTLDVFEDNGHSCQKLAFIAKKYTPPPCGPKHASSSSSSSLTQPNRPQLTQEPVPTNLFILLPFHDTSEDSSASKTPSTLDIEEQRKLPYALIPFIPGLSHQLKRTLNKAGCKTFFT